MRHTLFIASIICLAACALASRPTKLLKDEFVGDWKIHLTPSADDASQPGVKEFDEILRFAPDKLSTPKVLAKHGFGPSPYDEDVTAFGPAKFKCTQKSDKEGQIDWQGTLVATSVQGTMVWTHADKSVTHYDYQGDKGNQ